MDEPNPRPNHMPMAMPMDMANPSLTRLTLALALGLGLGLTLTCWRCQPSGVFVSPAVFIDVHRHSHRHGIAIGHSIVYYTYLKRGRHVYGCL